MMPPDARGPMAPGVSEGVREMTKKVLSFVLSAGLVLVGVPGSAEVFGPNTVWGSVPATVSDAANAILLDAAGNTLSMVPIVDGKFAFRDLPPGQYAVALRAAAGREVARSLPVDLAAGDEKEAVFSGDKAAAAVPPPASAPATPPATTGGGLGRTGWILIGAAAVGITTAVVIATNDDEGVASPSR
jgi:hypothetical protein